MQLRKHAWDKWGERRCQAVDMVGSAKCQVPIRQERVRASHLYLNRGEVPLARSLKLYKALLYILYTFKIRNFRSTGPPLLLLVVLSPLVYTLPDNAALCCAAAFWAALLQSSRNNGKMQRNYDT